MKKMSPHVGGKIFFFKILKIKAVYLGHCLFGFEILTGVHGDHV
jgi:hypothetical protein